MPANKNKVPAIIGAGVVGMSMLVGGQTDEATLADQISAEIPVTQVEQVEIDPVASAFDETLPDLIPDSVTGPKSKCTTKVCGFQDRNSGADPLGNYFRDAVNKQIIDGSPFVKACFKKGQALQTLGNSPNQELGVLVVTKLIACMNNAANKIGRTIPAHVLKPRNRIPSEQRWQQHQNELNEVF